MTGGPYGLPVVFMCRAVVQRLEQFRFFCDEAGALQTTASPKLSQDQRDAKSRLNLPNYNT